LFLWRETASGNQILSMLLQQRNATMQKCRCANASSSVITFFWYSHLPERWSCSFKPVLTYFSLVFWIFSRFGMITPKIKTHLALEVGFCQRRSTTLRWFKRAFAATTIIGEHWLILNYYLLSNTRAICECLVRHDASLCVCWDCTRAHGWLKLLSWWRGDGSSSSGREN
jgi:hypothetical protein